MAASTFITILTFTSIFVFILALYGANTGLVQVTGPMSTIIAPWPSFFIGKCSAAVFCVNQVGDFFASLGSIIFTGFNKIGAVFFLLYGIFTVLNTYSGLPFLGWFFTLMMMILAINGWMLVRSGHHD